MKGEILLSIQLGIGVIAFLYSPFAENPLLSVAMAVCFWGTAYLMVDKENSKKKNRNSKIYSSS